MKPEKISLNIVGLIWVLVSLRLFFTGSRTLLTFASSGQISVALFVIAILIGLSKGKFILEKVAQKYCRRAETIKFNNNDIFVGWIKVLSFRGFALLGIMMSIGFFLRNSNINKLILGVICLAVSVGLGYASRVFFEKAKTS